MASDVATEWVERMAALTVAPARGWPVDEVTSASTAAALLVSLAGDLRTARPRTELDVLARDLAALAPHRPRPLGSRADRRRRFRTALAEAGFAVYVCRRVLHPAGTCLFGEVADGDLCGRVLAAAHRVSAA